MWQAADHRRRLAGWGWSLALATALVLGGGDWTAPHTRLAAQGIAVVMIGCALAVPPPGLLRPTAIDWVVGALLALFALHLLPLPPTLWTALPGRAIPARIDAAVFDTPSWRPLSLDPEATLRSLAMLLPAFAVFLTIRTGGRSREKALLLGIVLAAGTALVLALVQRLSPPPGLAWPYPGGGRDLPYGFFASRNHHATFLLCALPLGAAWLHAPRPSGRRDLLLGFGALLLSLGVLATGSRTGALLLIPCLAATAWAWMGGRRIAWRLPRLWWGAAALVLSAGGALVLLLEGGGLLAMRPGFAGDPRFGFWPFVLHAAEAYWPAGSGIGTFVEAYQMREPLTALSHLPLNHAHNDYLEIALEAGLPGILLTAAAIMVLVRAAGNAWHGGPVEARLASVAVAVCLIHSAGDYPLRTISVSCLLAFAAALLARREGRSQMPVETPPPSR